jgi:hypothetical protein
VISCAFLPASSRSNEAISLSRDGLYEPGPLRIILERLTNFSDRAVDAVVSIEEDAIPPDSLDNLFSRDQLSSLLNQQEQDFHRNAFQPEHSISSAQFVGTRIELEIPLESDDLLGSQWFGCHEALLGGVAAILHWLRLFETCLLSSTDYSDIKK